MNYNFYSRLLHQLALGSSLFGEAVFDLEAMVYGSKTRDVSKGNHVFVAGLARAGTTILMRQLYQTGTFCSLTYRNMPFVLAPNLWCGFTKYSRRKKPAEERSHGDGIFIDYDSPEAFEEVFWRIFCGSDYIQPDKLSVMHADKETTAKFRLYVALILKDHSDKRYLSKNNNNILRLDSIARAFPNATILIPFREPVQHVFSLIKQHTRFIEQHNIDTFSRKYMAWLVHHEFGSDHRPFDFNDVTNHDWHVSDPNYWLRLWVNTYSYILSALPPRAIPLSYEQLCDTTDRVWDQLTKRIDISPDCLPSPFQKSYRPATLPLLPSLQRQAQKLHEELLAQSNQLLYQ